MRMFIFRKKFKRSNTFFYRDVNDRANLAKNDLGANIPSVTRPFEQEVAVACNVDMSDDNGQAEEYVEDCSFEQDSSSTHDHQHDSIIDVEESSSEVQLNQSHVSHAYHYGWLLLQFGYVTDVFKQQSFALHDYNINKRTIVHTSYVFVHRYPHLLLGEYGWVLCCSCDQSRMKFVQALNDQIGSDLHQALPYPSCLHISAMERFLDVYDKQFGVDPKDVFMQNKKEFEQGVSFEHSYNQIQHQEDMFRAVCGGIQWIAVKPVNGQWGVCTFVYSKVTPPQPELKCCSCSTYHCIHVIAVARGMEEVQEDDGSPLALFKMSLQISPEMRDYFEMATRSKEKVQLVGTGIENDANDYANLPEKNGLKFFVPSSTGYCSCGAEWDGHQVKDEWLDVERCSVVYLYAFQHVNVYYRPCSTCENKKRFDGIENKVIWFGSFCISHAVLKDYIRLFLNSSLPMYKYYVAHVQRHVSSGNLSFGKEISYTKFRLSVIAMIRDRSRKQYVL